MGVTLSIGTIQNGPEYYFDVNEIIQKADKKMYEVKQNHRSLNKQS